MYKCKLYMIHYVEMSSKNHKNSGSPKMFCVCLVRVNKATTLICCDATVIKKAKCTNNVMKTILYLLSLLY